MASPRNRPFRRDDGNARSGSYRWPLQGLLLRDSPPSGSRGCRLAYFPESYGERIIKLALDILNHKPVPTAQFMTHELVTPLNVNRVYPHDEWMKASMPLQAPIPNYSHLDFRSARGPSCGLRSDHVP